MDDVIDNLSQFCNSTNYKIRRWARDKIWKRVFLLFCGTSFFTGVVPGVIWSILKYFGGTIEGASFSFFQWIFWSLLCNACLFIICAIGIVIVHFICKLIDWVING